MGFSSCDHAYSRERHGYRRRGRTREAKHSRELAREDTCCVVAPALQPGERTLGLFTADDGDVLEEALAPCRYAFGVATKSRRCRRTRTIQCPLG
jgi:hypothetical protein